MDKIHKDTYNRFITDFKNEKYKNQRFGQAFCNAFDHTRELDKKAEEEFGICLFNEEDKWKIIGLIEDNFVNWHPEVPRDITIRFKNKE